MILITSAALALIGSLAPAYGAYFTDDFESNATGGNPAGWILAEADEVAIIATNAPGTTGTNAVQILNQTSTTTLNPTMKRSFTDCSTALTVEFDYMFTNDKGDPNFRIQEGIFLALNLKLTDDATHKVRYSDGLNGWVELGPALSPNTWYHFQLDINTSSQLQIQLFDSAAKTNCLFSETNLNLVTGRTVDALDTLNFRYSSPDTSNLGNYTIDNVTVLPEAPTTSYKNKTYGDLSRLTAIYETDKKGIVIDGCSFTNVGIMIVLSNCTNVVIKNCIGVDLWSGGIVMLGKCVNVDIINNDIQGFTGDRQGGHMISTQPLIGDKSRNISVINNRLIGPSESWYSGYSNGATGDMIAMKSVDGFDVRRNTLTGGGEYGITSIGSTNGVIADNDVLANDATGIFVGYDSGSIRILDNYIYDAGMSYGTGVCNIVNSPGIRLYKGAEGVEIQDNTMEIGTAPEYKYGLELSHCTVNIYGNTYIGTFVDEERVANVWSNTVTITREDYFVY